MNEPSLTMVNSAPNFLDTNNDDLPATSFS